MKTTKTTSHTGYKPGRFNPAIPVPAMPCSNLTVEEQIEIGRDFYMAGWQEIENEIRRRNGQDKPCPTDISSAEFEGHQTIVIGIFRNSTCQITEAFMNKNRKAWAEFVEYVHYYSSRQFTAQSA